MSLYYIDISIFYPYKDQYIINNNILVIYLIIIIFIKNI